MSDELCPCCGRAMPDKEIQRLKELLMYEQRESAAMMELAEENLCLKERVEELESKISKFIHGENEGPKGVWIDRAQIREAWKMMEESYCIEDVLLELGIERCGCSDPLYCGRCKDEGWVVK